MKSRKTGKECGVALPLLLFSILFSLGIQETSKAQKATIERRSDVLPRPYQKQQKLPVQTDWRVALHLNLSNEQVQGTGKANHGLTLSLSSPSQQYQPLSPILIFFDIKNISPRSVQFGTDLYHPLEPYTLTVQKDNGDPVPLTQYGTALFTPPALGVVIRRLGRQELSPLSSVFQECLINRLYDMSVSGVYRIFVKRQIEPSDGSAAFEVASNVIRIAVDERATPPKVGVSRNPSSRVPTITSSY